MIKLVTDLEKLIYDFTIHLKSLNYSSKTLRHYHDGWKPFKDFTATHHLIYFNDAVGKYIKFRLKKSNRAKVSRHESALRLAVLRLKEFNDTGKIVCLPNVNRKVYALDGKIGKIFNSFLEYKSSNGLSPRSVTLYGRALEKFLAYLSKKRIKKIEELDLASILNYILIIDCKSDYSIDLPLRTLREVLKYLFDHSYLKQRLYARIPKHRPLNQPKLPSIFSKKEIRKLLLSLERNSAIGKRNFAIVLIAAQTGMRASDLCNLKFENIKWETDTIEFNQVKTQRLQIHSLEADVGNAIIDYLNYGRPESDEPYIFLTAKAPFQKMNSTNVITSVVQRAFQRAGISTKDRRFGARSLRHSMVSRLQEQRTPYPVIAEVLGHGSTEATKHYGRIDFKALQECILDVPKIDSKFYDQLKIPAYVKTIYERL